MTQLVANVLDMTRLESGRAAAQARVGVVAGGGRVGAAAPAGTSGTGTRSKPHLDDAPPLIRADPVLLEQLFFNLLENAAKYTPRGHARRRRSPRSVATRSS